MKLLSYIFPHYVTVGNIEDINGNTLYIRTKKGDIFSYENKSKKQYWIGYFLSNIVIRVTNKGDFIASI